LGSVGLTALKEGLPETISYTDIRLVRGAYNRLYTQERSQQV